MPNVESAAAPIVSIIGVRPYSRRGNTPVARWPRRVEIFAAGPAAVEAPPSHTAAIDRDTQARVFPLPARVGTLRAGRGISTRRGEFQGDAEALQDVGGG